MPRKDKDPYVRLARAIIATGIKENDVRFLQSDWCDTLRSFCDLADHMSFSRDAQPNCTSRQGINKEFNHE